VSPGLLVSGVTPANILTSARPRNPILANAVRAVGLAEQAGIGVDRMYVAMTRIGHEPPSFTSEHDEVSVTLLGGAPNTHLARFVATLPPEDSANTDTLLIVYTLLHSSKVTAQDLAPLLQKPANEVETELRRLASPPLSIIEPTRQSARRSHPQYRLQESAVTTLGPAVTYRRRTQDEIDRKIVGIVQETGHVNARMVKLMLDLDAVPASRALSHLVSTGILVKTSNAQRGPSVTYGPGPAARRTTQTPTDRQRRKPGTLAFPHVVVGHGVKLLWKIDHRRGLSRFG
jgi:ATP-dependent DNA helicase RecG